MNFLSSLVPLETLPGWPVAPPFTVPQMLLLLIGFPLIFIAVVAIISVVRPAQSSYDAMQEREALWVAAGAPEALTERPGRREAIESADQAADDQAREGA